MSEDMYWLYVPDDGDMRSSYGLGTAVPLGSDPADEMEKVAFASVWLHAAKDNEGIPAIIRESADRFPISLQGAGVEESNMHVLEDGTMEDIDVSEAAGRLGALASTGRTFDPEIPQLLTDDEAHSLFGTCDVDDAASFVLDSGADELQVRCPCGFDAEENGWHSARLPAGVLRSLAQEFRDRRSEEESAGMRP